MYTVPVCSDEIVLIVWSWDIIEDKKDAQYSSILSSNDVSDDESEIRSPLIHFVYNIDVGSLRTHCVAWHPDSDSTNLVTEAFRGIN